jgi:hypothetical protein
VSGENNNRIKLLVERKCTKLARKLKKSLKTKEFTVSEAGLK